MKLVNPVTRQHDDGSEWGIKELSATVAPKNGDFDDYDFVLSLNDPNHEEIFGIKGQDLFVKGTATTLEDNKVDFEADITKFLLEIQHVEEDDPRIL